MLTPLYVKIRNYELGMNHETKLTQPITCDIYELGTPGHLPGR